MPMRAPTPCAHTGCGAASRERYCPAHRRDAGAERPSAAKRGYGRRWQRLRAMKLRRDPICECGQAATEVDHKTPLSARGTNAWDNLQSLCKPCHSRKTAIEQGLGGA